MRAYHELPDLKTLAAMLGGEVRGGEVLVPGPGHSARDRSLAVKLDTNAPGGFVVHSFAGDDPILCRDHVRDKLDNWDGKAHSAGKKNGSGKSWTTISEHVYYDEHGKPYLKVRKCLEGAGKKQFPQYHWEDNRWAKGKPRSPKIPYRLPQLIAAPIGTTIYFCEGEKDADNLAKLGFTTTTASEGAAAEWDAALTRYFTNRHVILLPDADRPGRAHAEKIARAINEVAASVRVLDLYPDRHDGSDVSNWLERDRAGAKLAQLAKEASLWEPASHGDADVATDRTKSDDELISELAALPRLTYARRRKEAAKQLGVTVTDLDKIVAEARGVSKSKEPAAALFPHWKVEACEEAVDGNALLGALIETLRGYIVLSVEQSLVVALWVIFTWVHEIAVHSPILLATSPLPNSGKTTLLKLISFLVRNGLSSVSLTGPALFRSIEKWTPTFSIDEADTALVNNDDLKDVVNSGWTRGDCVIRCDPETHDPCPYSTFCPKTIGMNGRKLPPATLSRCLAIAMRRKRPEEHVDDFDHVDNERLAQLRSRLLRWAIDNADALARAKPEKPPGLHNRAWMNWRLLLAIAERAGGSWKEAAWKAVESIEELHVVADPELGVQLLSDIRNAFDQRKTDRMTTKTLLEDLTGDEEGPWRSFGKSGEPLTSRQLSRLLKDYRHGFGIKSKTIRVEGVTGPAKGYYRADFEEDFACYLPRSSSVTVSQTSIFNHVGQTRCVTSQCTVTDENQPKSLEDKPCYAVTDENLASANLAEEREEREDGAPDDDLDPAPDDHTCAQCKGPVDGRERLCALGDDMVWLHPQCERFYIVAQDLPW